MRNFIVKVRPERRPRYILVVIEPTKVLCLINLNSVEAQA